MRRILVAAFWLFASPTLAHEWIATPVSLPARFERGEEQTVRARSGLSLAFGHRFEELVLFAEFQQAQTKSGTEFAGIDRRQTELTMWRQSEVAFKRGAFLYWNLGFGLVRQELTTRLDGLEEKSVGLFQPLAGVGLGSGYEMKKTLRISAEGRMYFSPEFDPNPQPEVSVRLGILF